MEIEYYDLRQESEPLFEDGAEVTPEELIETAQEANSDIFQDHDLVSASEFSEIEPEPYKDRNDWQRAMDTLIFSVSGQVPSDRESNLNMSATEEMRQYFDGTDRNQKSMSEKFVFGTLPYLFTGFGFKDQKWSKSDVNNFETFITFSDRLMAEEPVKASSFLCAHKKKREEEVHSLTDDIVEEDAANTLNMLRGVFANSYNTEAEVDFYQPGTSHQGLLSIFPGVIVKTAERGELDEIADLLDQQMRQMESLTDQYSNSSVQFQVNDVDDHFDDVHREAEARLGEDYRSLSSEELDKLADEGFLYRIAREETLPEVERLMPFYKEPGSRESIIEPEAVQNVEDEEIRDALEFYEEPMSAASKAFLETLFYHVWGEKCRENEELAIGLERDHALYQTKAFHYGHGDEWKMHHYAPHLYARRNNEVEENGNLHEISFRQFWR